MIFGYNGRDGVVTDDNGLIYMRARYYSPNMKRFINADIISGKLSKPVTLNRFAYANGNPVSFVDPFGLSAERSSISSSNYYNNITSTSSSDSFELSAKTNFLSNDSSPVYKKMIYVADTRLKQGLPFVGHTYIYILLNDSWYKTEFSGKFPYKSTAKVSYLDCDEIKDYNANEEIQAMLNGYSIMGLNYVVLEGDFDDSISQVTKYTDGSQDFGKYNLYSNNCSDYTDKILDGALVNGAYMQQWLDGDEAISIPIVRVWEASIAQKIDAIAPEIDRKLEEFNNTIREIGNTIENISNTIFDYAKKLINLF